MLPPWTFGLDKIVRNLVIFFFNTKIKEAYLGQAKFSSKVIYDERGLEIFLRGAVVLIFPMVEI